MKFKTSIIFCMLDNSSKIIILRLNQLFRNKLSKIGEAIGCSLGGF